MFSTLDLLAYLARRREPAHLLILGTYRPTEVIIQEHPLQEIVQELRGKGQCQELALENLTQGAVEVYLAERLESDTIHPQVVDIVYQTYRWQCLIHGQRGLNTYSPKAR